MYCSVLPSVWRRRGNQIARIPWTVEKVRGHLKSSYKKDIGSAGRAIYRTLSLDRDIFQEALHFPNFSQLKQATLRGISKATRFKFFDGDQRRVVRCCPAQGCADADKFERRPHCAAFVIFSHYLVSEAQIPGPFAISVEISNPTQSFTLASREEQDANDRV